MQRRVTLMRHGHAEDRADDFARELSPTGRAAATRAGRALDEAGFAPGRIVTSAARRALVTAELVARACAHGGAIVADRGLYLASPGQYLAVLHRLRASTVNVLLVGHNPGLSELARELCGYAGELTPAGYVSTCFELADWSELG